MDTSSSVRLRPVPLAAGVTAGLLTAVVAAVATHASGGLPDRGSTAAPPPCGAAITIAASREKVEILDQLAGAYHAAHPCTTITVITRPSVLNDMVAWATGGGTSPPLVQVWTPASSVWLSLLRQRAPLADSRVVNYGRDHTLPSVTATPMVFAMPQPVAERLRQLGLHVGWKDILDFAAHHEHWDAVKDSTWGDFKLGKTDPNYSTVGLHSLIAAYVAASGHPTLAGPDVDDPAVSDRIQPVEMTAVHYGDTTVTYLCNLAVVDAAGPAATAAQRVLAYLTAVPVEETSVYLYNQGRSPKCDSQKGRPTVPLVAVYPDRTVMSDSPYAILTADPGKRRLAEDFLDFLHRPAQQDTFKAAGFRGLADDGLAPDVIRTGGLEAHPNLDRIRLPEPPVVDRILTSWKRLRKPARVLFAVDVSLSMTCTPQADTSQPGPVLTCPKPAPGEKSRLDLVKDAASAALDDLADQDEIALWPFSGDVNDSADLPHPDSIEWLPMDKDKDRDAAKSAIRGLTAGRIFGRPTGGATALYVTIRDAQRTLAASAPASQITAVVVLTDGQDWYKNTYRKADLIRDIDISGKDHPVRVFAIAYTRDANAEELLAIAQAGGGWSYDATDPDKIGDILRQVVSNF